MTTDKKQCLLYYLGYYAGEIDGSWGTLSKAALLDFQKASGLQADGVFGSATEARILEAVANGEFKKAAPAAPTGAVDWWKTIKYFKRSEFACHCGGAYCKGFPAEPEQKLLIAADRVRQILGAPATVSSGVRCKTHNANVGGVVNSRHLTGKAMDFSIRGKTARQVLAVVQEQPEIRYAYAIDGTWVHMDIE